MRRVASSEWYTGTANAIYQNLEYMEIVPIQIMY